MADTTEYDETERGMIGWHCSEEDGGPDVGISLGLGGGALSTWTSALKKLSSLGH